ncbi:sigma-w pathway protein ysdB [Ammoniphilus resinae]|uniref:Sigma-w pathway protein ysdB n=1 Tax=Ammoniphilus resinae TaxID=861532 RepID=A0ABS4GJ92_9BACL|nr:sigma-w pathway protein ysdB [Ammoniphilus resinae]MBP1930332.1 hypothetical protein [Ammoniphilus resinae]
MPIFFRFILFIVFVVSLIWIITYLINPKRKLQSALESGTTLLMDNRKSVHQNLFLAYKGVLFEGEKYMGTTDDAFHIIKIHLWPKTKDSLVGLDKADFKRIEQIILTHYPHSQVLWGTPVREFLNEQKD